MNNENNVPRGIQEFTRTEFGRRIFANVLSAVFQGISRSLTRSDEQGERQLPPSDAQGTEVVEHGVEKGTEGVVEEEQEGVAAGVLEEEQDETEQYVVEEEQAETEVQPALNVQPAAKPNSHHYKKYDDFMEHLRMSFPFANLSMVTWPLPTPGNVGVKYCLLYAALILKRVSNVQSYKVWADIPYDVHDFVDVSRRGCEKLGLERYWLGSDLRKILLGDFDNHRFSDGRSVSTAIKVIHIRHKDPSEDEYKYTWCVWVPANGRGFLFPSRDGKAYRVGNKFMVNTEGYKDKDKLKKRNLHAQLTRYLWPGKAKNGNPNNYEADLYCYVAYAVSPTLEPPPRSKRSKEVASSGSNSKRAKML